MCGFAGALGPPRPVDQARDEALRMARTLAHRGPDDEGAWADPRGEAALAFRRLSILDLTPEGHQPMASADGRYTVVFNGEIYNCDALREELRAGGATFRGRSDTEVLLAAVRAWGIEATLPRLWGMFAIALWDGEERALHLVRDRLGKKPLYQGWCGSAFLFGSELKALRAHPAFAGELDPEALAAYLRFSYVPAPRSIYRRVGKVPPGCWLTVRPDRPGETPAPRRFWDPVEVARAGQAAPLVLSDAEAAAELERLLGDAVRLRMVADVPLGAFLSGGIDSSTVVALMRAQGRPAQTFTIGFTEREYDESRHAAAVARHLGCQHTELVVTPEEARAVIPLLPTLYDEPFADPSQLPTFLVSRLARRSVTVALSGDGADELFGGYNRYVLGTRAWSLLRRVPRPLRAGGGSLLRALPPALWDRLGRGLDAVLPAHRRGLVTGNRAHKVGGLLGAAGADALYRRLVSTWPEPERLLASPAPPPAAEEVPRSLDPAHRMMLADLLTYLPDDILAKVDRASMGTSLEARAPFLDHRVVEFAWRLPLTQKIRGGTGKWLVRQVLARHVPDALTRRPKQGFALPVDAWLRGPLREWAEELLSEARLRREGLLEPGPIRAALRDHLAGTGNRQYELWTVLMFQAWLEEQRQRASSSR